MRWKNSQTLVIGSSCGHLIEFDPKSSKLSSVFKVSETPVEFIDVGAETPHLAVVLAEGNRQAKLVDMRNISSQAVVATLEDSYQGCHHRGIKIVPASGKSFTQAKWMPDGSSLVTSSSDTV